MGDLRTPVTPTWLEPVRGRAFRDILNTFSLIGQRFASTADPYVRHERTRLTARWSKPWSSVPRRDRTEALERFVQLDDAWDKPEQVTAWRTNLDQVKSPKQESTKLARG
jgi:hypothetical protein